jgi:hypothetical protein
LRKHFIGKILSLLAGSGLALAVLAAPAASASPTPSASASASVSPSSSTSPSASSTPSASASATSSASPSSSASSFTPNALTYYDVIDENGYGYNMNDPGHGNIVKTVGTLLGAQFTFANETTWDGHNVYEMKINGGTACLNWALSGGSAVYDDSCINGDANEQWWHDGSQLVNAAATNYYHENTWAEAVGIYKGAQVLAGCCSINNNDSWKTVVSH